MGNQDERIAISLKASYAAGRLATRFEPSVSFVKADFERQKSARLLPAIGDTGEEWHH